MTTTTTRRTLTPDTIPAAVTASDLLRALSAFAESRPGLDWRDYGDARTYRSESARITRDLHDFRALFAQVAWRSITAADLVAAAGRAFMGRLSFVVDEAGRVGVDYTTGQYYPTEYRPAACAVLASALWDYWRKVHDEAAARAVAAGFSAADTTADVVRRDCRQCVGRATGRRYFA